MDTAVVAAALDRAADALLAQQHDDGWWKFELQTNVTMDAEDLLLREFLGIRTAEVTVRSAAWIRSQQRSDGTWASFYGGPPELSTTIEAYAALRLAGDPSDATHMEKAAAYVRDAGGIESARVFTKLWLSLFGICSWDEIPVVPPEMMFLPRWFPLNIYDFACWARQTIVPISIVSAHRPVHPVGFDLFELETGRVVPRDHNAFDYLDRALRIYQRRPPRALRTAAIRRAVSWIIARQEADGSWGGIQPPWVYSLLALHLEGFSLDHPVMRAGLAGIDGFVVDDEQGRRLEACQSPVWDTALAVIALSDAGRAPDDPALTRASSWLLDEEVRSRGDWSVRRPHLAPGGWAFEFANDGYPDIDDTAEVIMALRRTTAIEPARSTAAVQRGVRWVEGMQSRDNGWGAFDADNTRTLLTSLPFCDFGAVIDPPTADVTAHVIEMLAAEPTADPDVLRRGIDWLRREQEPDGAWFGRWGANYVYGIGAAVPALIAAGVDPHDRQIRDAVTWLEQHQNPDGGWGEDLRSYVDEAWRGRGESTASQTAWALLALIAAGVSGGATDRGVRFLIDTQRVDGTWDEPWFTGTGFPGDFYINYHSYRRVFPISALGRYLRKDEVR